MEMRTALVPLGIAVLWTWGASAEGVCDTPCAHGVTEISDQEICVCVCKPRWSPTSSPPCNTCLAAYAGSDCETCSNEEAINYPSCELCTVDAHCSGHANAVAPAADKRSCKCQCRNKWSGDQCDTCPAEYEEAADCNECANGYVGSFPDCKECSVKSCNNHATKATVVGNSCVCECAAHWEAPTCKTCPIEYDPAQNCAVCARGYVEEGGACRLCAVGPDCSNHATAVTSDNTRTKCVCTCSEGFSGAACNECADGYVDPPQCTKCSNSKYCNNNAERLSTEAGKCKCHCKNGYSGNACEFCAAGYIEESPNMCRECTSARDCSGHAASVTSTDHRDKCVCVCKNKFSAGDDGAACGKCSAPYGGNDCNTCDEEHINYPSCATKCNLRDHCFGNRASGVAPNRQRTACICDCNEEYEGDSCDSCKSGYIGVPPNCRKCALSMCVAGRASGMISDPGRMQCRCQCLDGYEGDTCADCERDHVLERSVCRKCSSKIDCNDHASRVTSSGGKPCTCECRNSYEGDACQTCDLSKYEGDCNQCKQGFIKYPECTKCDLAVHCNGNAVSVDSDPLRKACKCVCQPGYGGAACDTCADGYIDYANGCTKCTSKDHCNNRASSVVSNNARTQCLCTCTNYWNEDDGCATCSDLLTPACDACKDDAGVLPTCSPCNSQDHCNGNAKEVTKSMGACVCTCDAKWEGDTCDTCPAKYDRTKGCAACAPGLVGFPECRQCTVERDCTGHAESVKANSAGTRCICRGTWAGGTCARVGPNDELVCRCTNPNDLKGCPCGVVGCEFSGSCNNMWRGSDCSICPSQFEGADCNRCRDGFIRYPRCASCAVGTPADWETRHGCSQERTETVISNTERTECLCQCKGRYEDPPGCGRCSAGRIGFPNCGVCSVGGDCNNNAVSVTSDYNRTKCLCSCKPGFSNTDSGQCDTCSEGYYAYPECRKCTNGQHCNGHAVSVTDNGKRTGCTCSCAYSWEGDACDVCNRKLYNDACDGCAPGRVGYPSCFPECTQASCSNRAESITQDMGYGTCHCKCRNSWEGPTCNVCPGRFDISTDCRACRSLYANPPDCYEPGTGGKGGDGYGGDDWGLNYTNTTTPTLWEEEARASPEWVILFAVCGSLCGICVCCIALWLLFSARKKRQCEEEMPSKSNDIMVPLTNLEATTLLQSSADVDCDKEGSSDTSMEAPMGQEGDRPERGPQEAPMGLEAEADEADDDDRCDV